MLKCSEVLKLDKQVCAKAGVAVVICVFPILSLVFGWNGSLLFVLDGFRGSFRIDRHQRQPSGFPPTPIILSCPANAATITCHAATNAVSSPSPSPSPLPSSNQYTKIKYDNRSLSPSCPDFFRYIHEDLKPWKSTGITREMVETAKQVADFRLVVINGNVYFKKYKETFQTRDVFTVWGILQLLNRYPGRIPDLDLMFGVGDMPVIKAANYRSTTPPPMLRYCTDATSVEILFPDWSFWGWAEVNIKPWNLFLEDMKDATEDHKWKDRSPYAFWKGNPWVSRIRQELLKCNSSNGHDWNARLFAQDWKKEISNGFKESNLAKQCNYRYKIYVEGMSWSVSEKYILACNSPTLVVETPFIDFFSRGLMPGKHYWPINRHQMCNSLKFAVDWGNTHQKQAQDLGKGGSRFTKEDLSMENVYDYMLHLLTEYGKLMRYKPTVPENATIVCIESMACPATSTVKKFMLDSMVKSVYGFEPCALPPPFDKKDLDEIASRKEQYLKKVEKMETKWKL